jgi:hypothetical protein
MKNRALGAILILTAIVTVAYWINYFSSGDVAVISARWYTAYESSFPVADGWLALCSLLAGIGFLTNSNSAGRFGLLAGSALLYLAAMDITFDVENHLYPLAAQSDAMKFEIVINAWSLVLGIVTVATSWRRANG